MERIRSRLTLILVALTLGACSNGGVGGVTGLSGSGSLTVTVTSPSGVTPSVVVTGPSNYLQSITATQTLTGLAAGRYTIAAAAADSTDSIVGVPFSGTVTGSPATVTGNGSADASVSYTQRASRGLLWVTNYGAPASGFTSAQLAAAGTPSANVTVSLDGPSNFAIDASGGAWVSNFDSDTIFYYTQTQMLGGGTPAPTVTITASNGSLAGVTGIALDAKGDLWATNQTNNTLVEFTPTQLASSGAPTPAITITAVIGTLDRPFCLAFDASGNLWVGNINDSSIVGYSPTALNTGGGQVPFAAITNTPHVGVHIGLIFDSAGNLWVANALGSLAKFAATSLTGIGSPTPTVVVTMASGGSPGGAAFDDSGDLWVTDTNNNTLVEYSSTQLTTTGTPTPALVVRANGASIQQPFGIAFSPHSQELPLH